MTSTGATGSTTRVSTGSPTMIRALGPLNKSAHQRLCFFPQNVLAQSELNGEEVSAFKEGQKCTAETKHCITTE